MVPDLLAFRYGNVGGVHEGQRGKAWLWCQGISNLNGDSVT